MGFSTDVWGPVFWHVLHTVSFNIPPEPDLNTKLKYYRFLRSVKDILPCRVCREKYPGNIKQAGVDVCVPKRDVRAYLERNPHFRSRRAFSRMVYDLHKIVAKDVGSTGFQISYDELRRSMESLRAKCTDTGCIAPRGGPRCVLRVVEKKRGETDPNRRKTFRLDIPIGSPRST